jgi:hypothetical protein
MISWDSGLPRNAQGKLGNMELQIFPNFPWQSLGIPGKDFTKKTAATWIQAKICTNTFFGRPWFEKQGVKYLILQDSPSPAKLWGSMQILRACLRVARIRRRCIQA